MHRLEGPSPMPGSTCLRAPGLRRATRAGGSEAERRGRGPNPLLAAGARNADARARGTRSGGPRWCCIIDRLFSPV